MRFARASWAGGGPSSALNYQVLGKSSKKAAERFLALRILQTIRFGVANHRRMHLKAIGAMAASIRQSPREQLPNNDIGDEFVVPAMWLDETTFLHDLIFVAGACSHALFAMEAN